MPIQSGRWRVGRLAVHLICVCIYPSGLRPDRRGQHVASLPLHIGLEFSVFLRFPCLLRCKSTTRPITGKYLVDRMPTWVCLGCRADRSENHLPDACACITQMIMKLVRVRICVYFLELFGLRGYPWITPDALGVPICRFSGPGVHF
jgi:hypothetical protein